CILSRTSRRISICPGSAAWRSSRGASRARASACCKRMASETTHRFIVVEGPIGVGKTSLARRLCVSLSAQAVLEQAAQNPFLERFYRNPRAGALPAQLYFLLQRPHQLAAPQPAALFDPVAHQRGYDELLAAIRRMSRGLFDYNPLRSRAI